MRYVQKHGEKQEGKVASAVRYALPHFYARIKFSLKSNTSTAYTQLRTMLSTENVHKSFTGKGMLLKEFSGLVRMPVNMASSLVMQGCQADTGRNLLSLRQNVTFSIHTY